MSNTTTDQWWREHDNVVLTANYLAHHGYTAEDVALLVEKPWKFTDEYNEALAEWEAEQS